MPTLLVILLFIFMLVGVPIAFAILLSGAAFLAITDLRPMMLVVQRLGMGVNSFPLLAIPMFILAGYLMEALSISKRLTDWIEMLVGHVRGAMGVVTILASAVFAALTGSGPATVASIGSIMIPSMKKSGYSASTAAGLMAAAGTLGPIIPPSIAMIVYGSTMNLSIPKMFIGGIIPGLLITAMFIVVNTILTMKYGFTAMLAKKHSGKDFLLATWRSSGALLMPVVVLGGIYGGIFTPTEAGTICVVMSLLLGIAYRKINYQVLKTALLRTLTGSASVVFIVASANLFGWLLTATRLPIIVANAVTGFIASPTAYLIMLSIFLFIVGALMDTLAAIVLLAPVLVPIGIQLGVDPLHLGVVFCVNLIVGFVTPPFGINLFTVMPVANVTYSEAVRGVIPFMVAAILGVLLITFTSPLVTFLPGLAYK
ncbi:hypothetical protein FACS1894206_05530 [Deltaproteobacteria bacterium]|nr:hypothetical protein FACS1894206_05530 [Deltaproteobacteria bacterium]